VILKKVPFRVAAPKSQKYGTLSSAFWEAYKFSRPGRLSWHEDGNKEPQTKDEAVTEAKTSNQALVQEPSSPEGSCTFICSRDTLDGAYPSLMLAINSRRQGMPATIFYTFMGINVIRKGRAKHSKFIPAGVLGAIPGMATMATWMMKRQIDKAGMPTVEELLEMAQLEGVTFVACKMTMDMMQLKPADFIEGVEIQTAEDYIKHAKNCKLNMFT
jgi:peroxiredoxin family protein